MQHEERKTPIVAAQRPGGPSLQRNAPLVVNPRRRPTHLTIFTDEARSYLAKRKKKNSIALDKLSGQYSSKQTMAPDDQLGHQKPFQRCRPSGEFSEKEL